MIGFWMQSDDAGEPDQRGNIGTMTLHPDHKALMFVGAIAVLGAGVRVVRAATSDGGPAVQPALERQMQSADSAKQAAQAKQARKGKSASQAPGGKRRPRKSAVADGPGMVIPIVGANQRAHVNGKLDLDVATAAQIDSLPGVSPAVAKKIVVDRMRNGPFQTATGLRRVRGLTAAAAARLDSLVVFSGAIVAATASDTIVEGSRSARSRSGRGRPRPP